MEPYKNKEEALAMGLSLDEVAIEDWHAAGHLTDEEVNEVWELTIWLHNNPGAKRRDWIPRHDPDPVEDNLQLDSDLIGPSANVEDEVESSMLNQDPEDWILPHSTSLQAVGMIAKPPFSAEEMAMIWNNSKKSPPKLLAMLRARRPGVLFTHQEVTKELKLARTQQRLLEDNGEWTDEALDTVNKNLRLTPTKLRDLLVASVPDFKKNATQVMEELRKRRKRQHNQRQEEQADGCT